MKLLIVVDYQNDFVTGSLGCPQAEAIAPKIAAKIREYRENGGEIAFTMDTHDENYADTHEGRNLPIPHCIEDDEGWQLHGEIEALRADGDKVFRKPAFGSAELFDYLRGKSYDSIELIGVVTNICVISNAVLAKTALPETPVIVDSACVASNDDALGRKALDVMKSMHISVI